MEEECRAKDCNQLRSYSHLHNSWFRVSDTMRHPRLAFFKSCRAFVCACSLAIRKLTLVSWSAGR